MGHSTEPRRLVELAIPTATTAPGRSLSMGLGPFVETLPTLGKVGATIKILGTNLKSATSVSFNGAPATFKVISGSEITATVPTGATTGEVQVVTPKHTLKSNVVFRIP